MCDPKISLANLSSKLKFEKSELPYNLDKSLSVLLPKKNTTMQYPNAKFIFWWMYVLHYFKTVGTIQIMHILVKDILASYHLFATNLLYLYLPWP